MSSQELLPSWNEGPAKQRILHFVATVTDAGGRPTSPLPTASRPSTMTAHCGVSSRPTCRRSSSGIGSGRSPRRILS